MYLELVTPDKKVFEGEVLSAKMPGSMGEFEVLNSHAALISSLGKGKVFIKTKEEGVQYVVEGGVAEVKDDKVIILAEILIEE